MAILAWSIGFGRVAAQMAAQRAGSGTLVPPSVGGRDGAVGGASFRGILDEAAVYGSAM